jgi:ribose 5-phosphate isomerase B
MVIAIGADHGGFHLKTAIVDFLRKLGHEIDNLRTHSNEPVDYADYSRAVSRSILLKIADRGGEIKKWQVWKNLK